MSNANLKAMTLSGRMFDPLLEHLKYLSHALREGDLGALHGHAHPGILAEIVEHGERELGEHAAGLMDRAVKLTILEFNEDFAAALAPLEQLFEDLTVRGPALVEQLAPLTAALEEDARAEDILTEVARASTSVVLAESFSVSDGVRDALADVLVDQLGPELLRGAVRELFHFERDSIERAAARQAIARHLEILLGSLAEITQVTTRYQLELADRLAPALQARAKKRAMIALPLAAGAVFLAFIAIMVFTLFTRGDDQRAPQLDADDVGEILGEDPDVNAWASLFERSERERLPEELPETRRQAWAKALDRELVALHRRYGTEDLCANLDVTDRLGIELEDDSDIDSLCRDTRRAREEIEEIAAKNARRLADYEEQQEAVDRAARQLREAQDNLALLQAQAPLFSGYIHGRIASDAFEVSRNRFGRQRYVLVTTATDFTTTGLFNMRVKDCGRLPVTLKSGAVREFPCIKEADTSAISMAQMTATNAARELREARRRATLDRPSEIDDSGAWRELKRLEERMATLLASRHEAREDRGSGAAPASPPEGRERARTGRDGGEALLSALCELDASGTRCVSCPPGSMFEDAQPVTTIRAQREVSPGRHLIEVQDDECFHHHHGWRLLYLLDTSGSSPRLMTYFDGVMKDCVNVGEHHLACHATSAGAGGSQGEVSLLDVTRGERSPLVECSDATSYACSSRKTLTQGYEITSLKARDHDGDGDLDLTVNLTRIHRAVPLRYADLCEAQEHGVELAQTPTSVAFTNEGGGVFSADGAAPLPVVLEQWQPSWLEARSLSEARQRAILEDLPGSDEGWTLHLRRLSALRYARRTDALRQMTASLLERYPERARYLLSALARDCEEAADHDCAAWAHEQLLGLFTDDDEVTLRAAWFLTTSSSHRDLSRARQLEGSILEDSNLEPQKTLLEAELALHDGDDTRARQLLSAQKHEPLIQDKLSRLDDPTRRLEDTPRPLVPSRPFKGPREWGEEVPTGAFGEDELAVGLHLRAQKLARKKKWARAAALYAMARELARGEEARVVVELGWGKLHERAGKWFEARHQYRGLLEQYPNHDRVLNRAAWFSLTTPVEGVHDLESGLTLARRATTLTNEQDPSVLDTLAEAHAQRGEWADARELIERCQALDPSREYYAGRLKQMERRLTTAMKKLK